jgi:hypothetical protein
MGRVLDNRSSGEPGGRARRECVIAASTSQKPSSTNSACAVRHLPDRRYVTRPQDSPDTAALLLKRPLMATQAGTVFDLLGDVKRSLAIFTLGIDWRAPSTRVASVDGRQGNQASGERPNMFDQAGRLQLLPEGGRTRTGAQRTGCDSEPRGQASAKWRRARCANIVRGSTRGEGVGARFDALRGVLVEQVDGGGQPAHGVLGEPVDGELVVFVGELGDQPVDGLQDEGQPGVGVPVAGGRLGGAVGGFGVHGQVAAQQGAVLASSRMASM